MNIDNYVDISAGFLGGFLSWFIGGIHGGVLVLILLMVIDQITGLMKAFVLKRWSSQTGFHGISQKVCMFLFAGIANVIDKEMHIELLGHTDILRDAVICCYIANEGLSIIENAIELDVPIPDGLKTRFLSWYKKQLVSDDKTEHDDN